LSYSYTIDISWLSWFSKQPLRHEDLLDSVACVCKYFQYLALLMASIHNFRCTVHASLNLITFLFNNNQEKCFLTSWQWCCLSFFTCSYRVCTHLFKPHFILLSTSIILYYLLLIFNNTWVYSLPRILLSKINCLQQIFHCFIKLFL